MVRGHYAPSLVRASEAAWEVVIDLSVARRAMSGDRGEYLRHVRRAIDRIVELDDALRPNDVEVSLDRVLDPAMEVARVLDLDPASVIHSVCGIVPTLDRAITGVTYVAGELVDAVSRAMDRDGGIDGSLGLAIDRARDVDRALNDVLHALNDFAGTDLRDVDLAAIPLGGVRWSRTTRWPPGVARRIERESDEIGRGVFEVREDTSDAAPTRVDQGDAWTVTRAEADHIAQLWATAGQSPAYPLVGSVVAEFDLGYVLTEALPPEYAPLSAPRWAVVDRETGDLMMWRPELFQPLSVDTVIERYRTWHSQRPPMTRTWARAVHDPTAMPSHVTYLRLPSLHPKVPDRWIRACGVDKGNTVPTHHPLVRRFLDTLPPEQRPERCSNAAAASDALYTEDAARAATGRPPMTLEQARNRLFVNAAMVTYRLRGPGGPAKGEPVPPCPSCELLIRHFSYQDKPADTVEKLWDDLQSLARTEQGADGPAELDAAIAVFRRVRQDGPTQEVRDLGTERLFEALVRRFREEGNFADLDDVIEMHEIDTHRIAEQRTKSAPVLRAPGERWVEEAYRQRAKITDSSVDHTIAATMRWFSPGDGSTEPAFDLKKVVNAEGYTIRAANARSRSRPNQDMADEVTAEIARLRTEPDLECRVDLLDRLVDALGALDLLTGSAQTLDELIDALELLIRAIPEEDVHHRAVHRCGLGGALYYRRQGGGGPEDAHNAFVHLEYAATFEGLETNARIEAARIAAAAAASVDDRPAAARMLRLAIDLLPRLVPRHLSPSDHARLLTPMSGLVSEAATGVLRAGDPEGALELLEQGRGLLIGRALDARDGTTEELRRIADALASSLDPPPAEREPGEVSVVDQRRELGRAWEREVARIRTLAGFEDYLRPLRLAELAPLAASGPLVTIVVSGSDANALLLTRDGVDVVSLSDLTSKGVDEMVDTFWGALPFAELMPDDDSATVQAQEPLRKVLARLWDELAAPVLERVGPEERIWWVPTGLVAALPLHAAGHSGADSVLDRVVSSYTPTIKVLRAARSRTSGRSDTACVVTVADAPGLPALPRTRDEAFEVMRRFPAVAQLDGPAATPEAVLAAVSESGWLHLACHATSNVRDPANCALHVHGGEVSAREVMAQRTSSGRLAYLSSCRTAMANGADVVDEMIHLGSAFQIAGFRHVVGTLWRVNDAKAAKAAKLFYRQVGSTEDYAPRALHDTVLRLRERYPLMPARWAPYVHLGG